MVLYYHCNAGGFVHLLYLFRKKKEIESKGGMERDLEFEFPDHPYKYCFSEQLMTNML